MESIQNIVEYYDELFPVKEAQKKFYRTLAKDYPPPAKFLSIGCGAGMFEHSMAREGFDVTGIEIYSELLRTANLRRKPQLMSIRYFLMSYLDMTRFLGKGFYNIIYSLDSRLLFIHDKTLLRKFFYDCKQLLSKNGALILGLHNFGDNFSTSLFQLPVRESIRARLFSEIQSRGDGKYFFVQNLETGSGKLLPIMSEVAVQIICPKDIKTFAEEAGFTDIEFYADFDRNSFTGSETSYIACLR